MWAPLAIRKVQGNCPSFSARTQTLTWQQILLAGAPGRNKSINWIVNYTVLFISLRSVSCCQIKHSSRYHVFWVWWYQRIGDTENEIRRSAMESWTSWMMAQQTQEASRCDSTIRSCCTAISQPSSCQLSTMQDANAHFIFMAFHAHRESHRQTLAASRQIYSSPWVLSAVCIEGGCAIGKRVRRLG